MSNEDKTRRLIQSILKETENNEMLEALQLLEVTLRTCFATVSLSNGFDHDKRRQVFRMMLRDMDKKFEEMSLLYGISIETTQ